MSADFMFDEGDDPFLNISDIVIRQNAIIWEIEAKYSCTPTDSTVVVLEGTIAVRLGSLPSTEMPKISHYLRGLIVERIKQAAEGTPAGAY